MNTRFVKYLTLTLVVNVLVVAVAVYFAPKVIPIDENALYYVTRVLDGDTFVANIGNEEMTVRMLGINTPETVDPRRPAECYGKEASDETKSLIEGRQVRLKLNPKREVLDKYGRYLAYVYRDEMFINSHLLRNGFAEEYTYGKTYSEQRNFKSLEWRARKSGIGLWGACRKTPL